MTTTTAPRIVGDTRMVGDLVTLVIDGVPQGGDYVISHAVRNGEWRLRDEFGCYVSAYPTNLVARSATTITHE